MGLPPLYPKKVAPVNVSKGIAFPKKNSVTRSGTNTAPKAAGANNSSQSAVTVHNEGSVYSRGANAAPVNVRNLPSSMGTSIRSTGPTRLWTYPEPAPFNARNAFSAMSGLYRAPKTSAFRPSSTTSAPTSAPTSAVNAMSEGSVWASNRSEAVEEPVAASANNRAAAAAFWSAVNASKNASRKGGKERRRKTRKQKKSKKTRKYRK
jgi:hypothetical protein